MKDDGASHEPHAAQCAEHGQSRHDAGQRGQQHPEATEEVEYGGGLQEGRRYLTHPRHLRREIGDRCGQLPKAGADKSQGEEPLNDPEGDVETLGVADCMLVFVMVSLEWWLPLATRATVRAEGDPREGVTLKLLGNGKLTAEFDTDCGATREILNRVGDKWSVLVVVLLGEGTMRFNEIRRAVDGISQRMLTSTLRGLERDGLVKRTVHPTNPPQVEYTLTKLGQTLLAPVRVLAVWAQGHRAEVMKARAAFDSAQPRNALQGDRHTTAKVVDRQRS